jgi:hypothetical protein
MTDYKCLAKPLGEELPTVLVTHDMLACKTLATGQYINTNKKHKRSHFGSRCSLESPGSYLLIKGFDLETGCSKKHQANHFNT